MTKRTYSKLIRLKTFKERFDYLKLDGKVGMDLFGDDRPLNQAFYHSNEWNDVRNFVLVRDRGLDLGCKGYEIVDRVIVHHMNPISISDLEDRNPEILDPNYLITVSEGTHRAIHYGYDHIVPRLPTERKPGDTRLW